MAMICDSCKEVILQNETYFRVNIATYPKLFGDSIVNLGAKEDDPEERDVLLFKLKNADREILERSTHENRKFDFCKKCHNKFLGNLPKENQ